MLEQRNPNKIDAAVKTKRGVREQKGKILLCMYLIPEKRKGIKRRNQKWACRTAQNREGPKEPK